MVLFITMQDNRKGSKMAKGSFGCLMADSIGVSDRSIYLLIYYISTLPFQGRFPLKLKTKIKNNKTRKLYFGTRRRKAMLITDKKNQIN